MTSLKYGGALWLIRKKNDCERNAAKRFLTELRREHPHLKLIVIEDGLVSNGPHIKQLNSLNLRFILGAKETDHRFLFDWVASTAATQTYELIDESGVSHRFRYLIPDWEAFYSGIAFGLKPTPIPHPPSPTIHHESRCDRSCLKRGFSGKKSLVKKYMPVRDGQVTLQIKCF